TASQRPRRANSCERNHRASGWLIHGTSSGPAASKGRNPDTRGGPVTRVWPEQGRVMSALVISLAGGMPAPVASTTGTRDGRAGSGNGSAGSGNGTSGTVTGAASCAAMSASAYLAGARAVFIGTALGGPTAEAGSAGAVLLSPARFHVIRYLKGSGPRVVTVQT